MFPLSMNVYPQLLSSDTCERGVTFLSHLSWQELLKNVAPVGEKPNRNEKHFQKIFNQNSDGTHLGLIHLVSSPSSHVSRFFGTTEKDRKTA